MVHSIQILQEVGIMNESTNVAITHLIQTGVINANTGKVDLNKIGKSGITVSSTGNRGGGVSRNASGKNSTRDGK